MKKYILLLTGVIIGFSSFCQQNFTDFQNADLVIGQPDFSSRIMNYSDSFTYAPAYMAISSQGMLAVAEQTGGSIKIWYKLPETNSQPADVEVGNPDFGKIAPGPSEYYSDSFNGVAWSPDGNKLIASCGKQNRVLIWNSIPEANGQPADVVLGQKDFYSTDASAKKNTLNSPAGILVAPDGRLLVADMNNNRVMIWNSIPITIGKEADVVIGQPTFNDSVPGSKANELHAPRGLHLTADNRLLVTNVLSHSVFIYDSIPVSDNESATVVIGQDDFGNSSFGTSEYKLNMPFSVVVTQGGKLAIADYGNNRVLIYNTIPAKNGAGADIVLGQKDFYSSIVFAPDGFPASNNFYGVTDVKSDLNGRLWVAGDSMNRAMVFGEKPKESAELTITLEPSDVVLCEISDIVYKITLFNEGPDSAFHVVAAAAFPLGYTFENSMTENGMYYSNSGYWKIPSIAPGESAILYIDGYVNNKTKGLSFTSYANIIGSSAMDKDLSNNTINTLVTIEAIKLPDDPIVYNAQVCEGEKAMLFADGSGTILWYSEDDWFNPIAKGLSISTGPLTESITYYAKTSDVCPGNTRVPATVNVGQIFNLSETVFVCSGSSYTYPDGTVQNNITSPASHISNLNTILGCDSIITTTVNVNPTYNAIEYITVCQGDSYTFPDGTTQTDISASTEYTSNLYTVNGCDSIIITEITVMPVYNGSETISICEGESYTFPDGTIQSDIHSSLEYISYLQTVNGCDSIIVTTVHVYPAYDATESVTVCQGDSYTFPDGTVEYDIMAPLSHTSMLVTANGCDSIMTTYLEIITVDVSVIQDGSTLTANNTSGTYQWIDCAHDNEPLAGETGQSFTPSQSGSYAVRITENGCTDTSDCYSITFTGMRLVNAEKDFIVFPNPAKDKLTIQSHAPVDQANIIITNLQGSKMLEQAYDSEHDLIEINLRDLKSGVYLIHFYSENITAVLKFLKE